jgi:hypothetical protein
LHFSQPDANPLLLAVALYVAPNKTVKPEGFFAFFNKFMRQQKIPSVNKVHSNQISQ